MHLWKRNRRVVVVALVTVALLPVAPHARSGTAAFPGSNGPIVWVAGPSGSADVWAMDPDGGNKRKLTASPGAHGQPTVSPDGTRVAFQKGTEIWVMSADGSEARRVSPAGASRASATWSPQGDRLAWTDGSRIYVFSLEDGTESVLRDQEQTGGECSHTVGYGRPRWSPSGDRLVAVRYTDPPPGNCSLTDPQRDLVLVAVPGGDVTVLTDDETLDEFPDWAPDGDAIVFQRGDTSTGLFGISKMPAQAGGAITTLTHDIGAQPRFSPDGTRILFVRDANGDGRFDLWTMNPTGGDLRSLLQDDKSNSAPDWGPVQTCSLPEGSARTALSRFAGSSSATHVSSHCPIVVNSTSDLPDEDLTEGGCDTGRDLPGTRTPECTLPAAIQVANARGGRDVINFDIEGPGPHEILVGGNTDLTVKDPAVIDATSQPGYAGTPVIEVDGGLGGDRDGFQIQSRRTKIAGLSIAGFEGAGITVTGAGVEISRNYVGLTTTGDDRGANGLGVVVSGSAGEDALIRDNRISAEAFGIWLKPGSRNARVLGNEVVASRFAESPVVMQVESKGSLIGDGTEQGRNVVDSHSTLTRALPFRVVLGGSDNRFEGNRVGESEAGTIRVAGNANVVGGSSGGDGNDILGHVLLVGGIPAGNVNRRAQIVNNRIRSRPGSRDYLIDIAGNRPGRVEDAVVSANVLTGGLTGIRLHGAVEAIVIRGNFITAAEEDGITIERGKGEPIRRVRILRNRIWGNGAFGIDLNDDGVTKNDLLDRDKGPNDLQNFPDELRVVRKEGSVTVSGRVRGATRGGYVVELFANAECDESGFGEGEIFLGSIEIDAREVPEFTGSIGAEALGNRTHVTAVAIDPAGNSSEFSKCVQVERS